MKQTRIGFVGVGFMGQSAHLRNYITLPDTQVVAIAEPRRELAEQVGRRYGIARVYSTAAEMLEKESLDGIVASQQFTKHGSIVPGLLAHGLPVLTEKPLAGSLEAGERILAAQSNGKGKVYIGYHKRSDPATVRAKQQIAAWQRSNEVGRLKYVRIAMPPGDWIAAGGVDYIKTDEVPPNTPDDLPPQGMDTATAKQFVAFVNYYIHQVNLLGHLLGEPYRVDYADPSGVLLAARSESGVCGVIEMATHQTTLDWQEEAFIAFERGWIKLELPAPLTINRAGRVTIFRDADENSEPTTLVPTLPWVHAMRAQAINFVNAINGEATPLCEAPEALRNLQIANDYVRKVNDVRKAVR